jgi:superfamily I DNA/RNA helicase
MSAHAKYLADLNERQREAVRQTEGPVLVLAGAGSGKTRVITRRIAYLISKGLAEPSEILAVTFTNKAADEMRERVAELVGKAQAAKVVISTFHSFCLMVLRKDAERMGMRKNFTIASESDARILLRRVVEDLGTTEALSVAEFQSSISLYKNQNEEPDPERMKPVERESQEKYQEHIPTVYEGYRSALRAANSVDFDDLLLLTLKLWQDCPEIGDAWRDRFKYVMVDEYQDTNKVQYDLMRALVEKHRNFCVVGDDDQSIYAWRGADIQIILGFERHFPDAKIITLDQNYRSTETILAAANAVIRLNTSRRPKELWSTLGKGRAIDWFVVANEEEEAKEAVAWLKSIQEKTGARHSDFAMLYRSNLQSKPLEIALRQAGIPYTVVGGQDFFERAEVKDIVSYLKLLANPRDESAFLRVINMPRRGIGDVTLHRVHEVCVKEGLAFAPALAEVLRRGEAPAVAEQGIRNFLGLVQHFRKKMQEPEVSLRGVIEELITAINYHRALQDSCKSPLQLQNRWQNVESVVQAVSDYEENTEHATLSDFLDKTHLNSNERFSKQERRKTGVTLMTIHSAKGLEYPFVFIHGCEDGLMPHEKSTRDGNIDEERRLFYVALTRGKRHVTLFECLTRSAHGRERMTKTSRFLADIPQELLNPRIRAVRAMVAEATGADQPKPKAKRRPRKPKMSGG